MEIYHYQNEKFYPIHLNQLKFMTCDEVSTGDYAMKIDGKYYAGSGDVLKRLREKDPAPIAKLMLEAFNEIVKGGGNRKVDLWAMTVGQLFDVYNAIKELKELNVKVIRQVGFKMIEEEKKQNEEEKKQNEEEKKQNGSIADIMKQFK